MLNERLCSKHTKHTHHGQRFPGAQVSQCLDTREANCLEDTLIHAREVASLKRCAKGARNIPLISRAGAWPDERVVF